MPGTAVNVLPNLTVPVIVGVGAPVINGNETGAVAAEVFDASVNPAFFAVSVTVIVEPKSAGLIRYVAVVATGVPPTDHWYVNESCTGAHVPGVTDNVDPVATTPEITGTGVVANDPAPTALVTSLVFDVTSNPAALPVTTTEIC